MAEGGGSSAAPGGWWGSLMSAAKNKSAEVFEFMKRDFDEFSSVVKTEAASIASNTATAVKETLQLDKEESTASSVKRSVSSLIGSLQEALSPSPSSEFEEALIIHDGNPVAMTKLQKKVHALVSDDSTYLDPVSEGERSQFEAWLGVVEETLNSIDRLTHLLSVNPTLQEKYTNLVPDKVSHTDFWQRYLFKKAVLEDREAELERKEDRDRKAAESYPWEKEGTLAAPRGGGGADPSEEEQTRILAEYERERLREAASGIRTKSDRSQQGPQCEKEVLTVKEKRDMVIVSTGGNDVSQASSSSKASTDGDWEKEFDLEDQETGAAGGPQQQQADRDGSGK